MGGILGKVSRVKAGPVLDVAGLSFLTTGAGLAHIVAGFAMAGVSCMLLAWRYGE